VDSVKTATSTDNQTSLASPLMHIEGFLEALTTADKDGRIFIDQQGSANLCLSWHFRLLTL